MEDIKSLYLAAKSTGSERDVDSYVEAVNGLLDKNPNGYIRNIEYIISSSIGLKTFKEFVDKYGLSIAAYDSIMEAVDNCINRCDKQNKDHKEYDELKEGLEEYRESYSSCFSMFQYYMTEDVDDYIKTYYSFNSNGVQNAKLVSGMIGKFGEMAIPDLLITANKMKGLRTVLECVDHMIPEIGDENYNESADPLLADWMLECATEIMDEASHSNLKYDHRLAVDAKTGHKLHIIYSLDGMKMTQNNVIDTMHRQTDGGDKTQTGIEALKKKGNMDHESYNQKVLAIIDMDTGEKLNEVTCKGPFGVRGDKGSTLRVGEVDMRPTYKSTYWDKDSADVSHISQRERIGQSRGVKAHQMDMGSRAYNKNRILSEVIRSDNNTIPDETKINSVNSEIQDKEANLEATKKSISKLERKMKLNKIAPVSAQKKNETASSVQKEVDKLKSDEKKQETRLNKLKSMSDQNKIKYYDKTATDRKKAVYRLNPEKLSNRMDRDDNDIGIMRFESCLESLYNKSNVKLVNECLDRNDGVYRESTIMGNPDVCYEYTEEEINAIKNLISYKEFQLTGLTDVDSIMECQNEIYSLYEELDGVIFEEDDTIESTKKKSTDFVPIYGVVKSYSEGKYRNDGSPKSKSELNSVRFKHQLKTLTRGDNYSHALVSFNDDLTEMYSYDDEGFVEDNINTEDSWLSTDSIYICVMFVTKEEKERMHKYCRDLASDKKDTKYAFANLVRAYIGKPVKQNKRFVCSTFTAFILQGSNPKNLHRDYSRIRPEDITILPRSFYVMNVKDRLDFNNKKDAFKKRVDEIYNEYKDSIEDYNNDLPKLMLKDKMGELKTIDKILDWIVDKV